MQRRQSVLDDVNPENDQRYSGRPDACSHGSWGMVRQLPAMVRGITRLAYDADSRSAILLVTFTVVSGCGRVLALLSTRNLGGVIFFGDPTAVRFQRILPPLLVTTCLVMLVGLLDMLANYRRAELIPQVKTLAAERLYDRTMTVELAAYDDPEWHDAMYRARDQGSQHAPYAFEILADLLSWSVMLIAALIVVPIVCPLLSLVLVCAIVPEAWAALRAAHRWNQGRRARAALHRRLRIISDLFSTHESAAEIRVQTARTALLTQYQPLAAAARREEIDSGRIQAKAEAIGRGLGGASLMITYAVLGLLLYRGALAPAAGATAFLAIKMVHSKHRPCVAKAGQLFEVGNYVVDYLEFLRRSDRRTYLTGGTPAPAHGFIEIKVRALTFTYPRAAGPALREVSFGLRRGEVVALVGENGSGKSTLAKLLAGLYLPQTGGVSWDGLDISGLEPHSLHEQIAIVTQQPTRWPMSARANITIGRHDRPDPGQAAVLRAARDADCDTIFENLPDGYDTILSEQLKGGHDLSGGQWQRLSLARGYYRDAPLTIFDEPTSALDPHTEARVLTDVARLRTADRTVVLITHRLAAARHCDRILVLHRGELVEEGTHDGLLERGGRYADMFEVQSKAFR